MLRGGPKISRRTIASRKPDVDLNIVTMSIFDSGDLEIGWVSIVYASSAAFTTDGGGSGAVRSCSLNAVAGAWVASWRMTTLSRRSSDGGRRSGKENGRMLGGG